MGVGKNFTKGTPQLPLLIDVGDSETDERVPSAAGPQVCSEPKRHQGTVFFLHLFSFSVQDVDSFLLDVSRK